jgi:hypothetical protein
MSRGSFELLKDKTDESSQLSKEVGEQSLWASLFGLAGSLAMPWLIPSFAKMGLLAKGGITSLGSILGNLAGREVKPISDDYTVLGNAPEKAKQEITDASIVSMLTAGITPAMSQMFSIGAEAGTEAGKAGLFQSGAKKQYAELFGPQLKGTDLWSKSMVAPKNLVQGGLSAKDAADALVRSKNIETVPDTLPQTEIDYALQKPDVVTDTQGNVLLEGDEATSWIDSGGTGAQLETSEISDLIPENAPLEDRLFDDFLKDDVDSLFVPNKISKSTKKN